MKYIISFITILAFAVAFPLQSLAQNTNETLNANLVTTQELENENDNSNENINANVNTNSALTEQEKTKKEQEAVDLINNPGMLPDNPFYFLKSWFEGIQLALTFDSAHEAEMEYRFALRRVAEASKLVEKGKVALAEKQLAKFEDRIENLSSHIDEAKKEKKDVDELVEKLEVIQEHQQEVLLEIYGNVPDEAKEAILRALEQSSLGLENAIGKVKGEFEAGKYRIRFEQRLESEGDEIQNEIKIKLKLMSDDEDEEEFEDENENENDNVNEDDDEDSNTNEDDDDEDDSGSNQGSGNDDDDRDEANNVNVNSETEDEDDDNSGSGNNSNEQEDEEEI